MTHETLSEKQLADAMVRATTMRSPAYHLDKAKHYMGQAIRSLYFSKEPSYQNREAFVRWRETASLQDMLDMFLERGTYFWPWEKEETEMAKESRTKSGTFKHGNSEPADPKREVIRRDTGRLTNKHSNTRAQEAEKRLKLKSFKENPDE